MLPPKNQAGCALLPSPQCQESVLKGKAAASEDPRALQKRSAHTVRRSQSSKLRLQHVKEICRYHDSMGDTAEFST